MNSSQARNTSSQAAAAELDIQDPLKHFRERFCFPEGPDGGEIVYFTGNSLGLQPKTARAYVDQELDEWAKLAVEGHLHARNPWLPYHEFVTEPLARVVGAQPIETVAMNGLTVNLHLLMVSFYRPTKERYKIVIEKGAFPSDQYAIESQLRFHAHHANEVITNYSWPLSEGSPLGDLERRSPNYSWPLAKGSPRESREEHSPNYSWPLAERSPSESTLIELAPREGESTLRTEDILETIDQHGKSIALILLGGVNYYSGQAFDMKAITEAGHRKGCIAGFDCAHAAGNLELNLHDWDVDFAAWCSYKYLNAGPGGIAGIFIHERHARSFDLPRFAGWWGHDKETRFLMGPEFNPLEGAEGWQISNPPILQLAALRASLEIFDEAGITNLRQKSVQLTGYLESLLDQIDDERISVITPRNPEQRGCQLSIRVKDADKQLFDRITSGGVSADWREPDVIRVAPVPLYNSFSDVHRFAAVLSEALR
ncbi:MAG TPA: kynureninase [Pyrinomonadaceae bacterium]|nr:kynureninase [Pyrinomonadaceae bacterium]